MLEFTKISDDGNVLSGVMSTRTEWVTAVISLAERVTRIALESWREFKLRPDDERPASTA